MSCDPTLLSTIFEIFALFILLQSNNSLKIEKNKSHINKMYISGSVIDLSPINIVQCRLLQVQNYVHLWL